MSPARARLPVCGQDFPCGPRDSQAAPKENNYSDRKEKCARSQTCGIGKRESVRGEVSAKQLFIPTTVVCLFVCLVLHSLCLFVAVMVSKEKKNTPIVSKSNLGLKRRKKCSHSFSSTLGYDLHTDKYLLHT